MPDDLMRSGRTVVATGPARRPVFLSMDGITKRFAGVPANDRIGFELRAGEIHALLGENGAGKTTLMGVLYGLVQPDSGEIRLEGRLVRIRSPKDAVRLGIGLVPQHFTLVRRHTVAENVALGLPGTPFFFPGRRVERRVRELSERYGLRLDPKACVWQLSAGEQQRLEILKVLIRGARMLILDEPTSVLAPAEVESLFAVLRRMREEGRPVVFISHKLDEVLAIADRVTVLRKGRVVATVESGQVDKSELARMMVGHELAAGDAGPRERTGRRPAGNQKTLPEPVLRVENLWAWNDRGLPAVRGVSFTVCRGEILGIAGVAGNGQRELVEVLAGLRQARSGRIRAVGRDLAGCHARDFLEGGVAHVPEDRMRMGIVPGMTVAENLALKAYRHPPISHGPLIDLQALSGFAVGAMRRYGIAGAGPDSPAGHLSGGNIQKLILARELSGRPQVIVASHPTYGLDVGATEQIHALLRSQRDAGAGILLVSEDLDEILALSDRVAVMFGGQIAGLFPARNVPMEQIGLMMAGVGAS